MGLAQAILHDPDLLILDEPTSGLDPNQIVEIRGLIQELGREKTVILSTHILAEAQTTCSRILIINDGRIVADDTPEHLASGQGGAVRLILGSRDGRRLEANKIRLALQGIPGVSTVEFSDGEGGDTLGFIIRHADEDPRRGLFEAAVTNGWVLLEVRRHQISLEDTFRRLTGNEQASRVVQPAA